MLQTQAIRIGLLLLVLLSLLIATYNWGKSSGESKIQEEWDKQVAETNATIAQYEVAYLHLAKQHAIQGEELRHEINQTQIEHQKQLSDIRNEYSGRLLSSENRANLYKRQAESGTIEHRNLADYAAELDRSLEEGRFLVQELRTTLRQREREIGILSKQIQNDRQLLDKAETVHGNK